MFKLRVLAPALWVRLLQFCYEPAVLTLNDGYHLSDCPGIMVHELAVNLEFVIAIQNSNLFYNAVNAWE